MDRIPPTDPPKTDASPWLTAREAAAYARVSVRTIYAACRGTGPHRLRHARLAGRRDVRVLRSWIDDWLFASAPQEVQR